MSESTKKPLTALTVWKKHEKFCKCLLDGYIVVNNCGKVLKSNPLFAAISGMSSKQVLKQDSISDVLDMKIGEEDLDFKELLKLNSIQRIDEVEGINKKDKTLQFIISIYPLIDGDANLGAFVIFKDVTAEYSLQNKYKIKAKQSITDSLTNLYNRAYFEEFLEQQVDNLHKLPPHSPQRNISLIMIDIDFFKKVNDNFGHPAGDYVIKTLAEIMKKEFRQTDICCRYGGEEFLAIFPGTELMGTLLAADKLRLSVANYKFVHEGVHIPITISIGGAQIDIAKENGNDTLKRADQALYFSKENGRNRTSVHYGKDSVKLFTGKFS